MPAPLAKRIEVTPNAIVRESRTWSALRFKAVADAGRRGERRRA
jgi:hypothetical protein